jgi:hypothetical protein
MDFGMPKILLTIFCFYSTDISDSHFDWRFSLPHCIEQHSASATEQAFSFS